jgi:hypothetical protein
MHQRQLLLAVAAVTALTLLLTLMLRRDSGPSATAAARAPIDQVRPTTRPEAQIEEVADAQRRDSQPARAEAPAQAPAPALAAGETEQIEDATPDGEVRVEVRVLAPDETAPLSPHPYAGGLVHTLSWDSETEETVPHSAPIDADGVARFRLPGPVHLDWFRSEVRGAAGLAPGFLESHEDLPAGALYRVAIQCLPGARVRGRVTALDGRALAGVEVAAYSNGDGVRSEWSDDWYPGHFTTQSGAGGEFEFAALPAGGATVVVRPGEWLQISPDYSGLLSGRASFELEPGETRDVGELKLARRAGLELLVVDAAGTPVASTDVEFAAVRFDDPYLERLSDWEARFSPEKLEEQHGGELDAEQVREQIEAAEQEAASAPIWCEEETTRKTDSNGRVKLQLVAGLWTMRVLPKLGDGTLEVRRDVRLPSDEIVVKLPFELASLAGRIVDSDASTPVGHARVKLQAGGREVALNSDREGRFRFDSVLLRGPYQLVVQHPNYFGATREFGADERDVKLELHPAQRLVLRIRDTAGATLPRGAVHVRIAELDPATRGEPRAAAWLSNFGAAGRHAELTESGVVQFLELWPGSYDVTLSLPADTGRLGEWGEVLPELVEVARWTLRSTRDVHELRVDLSQHRAAAPIVYAFLNASVVDAKSGASIDGAEVEIAHALRTRTFTIPGESELSVSLPVGDLRVTVRHPEYEVLELDTLTVGQRGVTVLWKLEPRP